MEIINNIKKYKLITIISIWVIAYIVGSIIGKYI